MALKQSELNPKVNLFLEISLILVISAAVLLHGGVADIYWYPIAISIVALFCASVFSWERGLIQGPKAAGVEIYFIALLALMILSALSSPHRWMSVSGAERLLVAVLFFYLMLWHFQSRRSEKILLWSLFAFPAAICLIATLFFLSKKPGFFPFLYNEKAVNATFVNHNNFAGLVILAFFLGLGLVMGLRRTQGEFRSELLARMAIISIPLIALLLGLAFSLSRSGWAAFAVAGAGFLAWLIYRSSRRKMKTYLGLTVTVIGVALLVGLLLAGDMLKERANTLQVFFQDPSSGLTLSGRRMIWRSTLGMIKDHPLLGIGPGNYWLEYPRYRNPGDFWGEYHAHNDLLQATAEGGIAAPVLVLLLFGSAYGIWRKNYRREMSRFQRRVSMGIVMGMLGFLAQDQIDFHFYIPGLAYYFLALAAFLVRPRGENANG